MGKKKVKRSKKAAKKSTKKVTKKTTPNRPAGRPRIHATAADAYLANVENTTERKNAQSATARELFGKIPEVADPERRERTRHSFEDFCLTYFPKVFRFPFNAMQRTIANEIEESIRIGGKKAVAAYRRGRKTTTSRAGLLWGLLQRDDCEYAIYLGATDDATKRTYRFFESQIFTNDLLLEDFPDVFFPFRETKGSRNKSLLWNGQKFQWKISPDEIIFPMIPGYKLAGRLLDFRSINSGAIRGADHTIFGRPVRPSIVLCDDIMTDESAVSERQNDDMYDKFHGTIDYLSGYGDDGLINPLPVLLFGTCIAPNDAMCRMLDREMTPDYRGVIYRRVLSMPKNMDLWRQYREIRTRSFKERGDMALAIEFYKQNRVAMDEGLVVADPNDMERGMISGGHYAMDTWARDERKFWTEQQNDPIKAKEAGGGFLTPSLVLDKVVPLPRYHIPEGTVAMTAFVDVGIHYLAAEVIAFGEKMKFAHVVDKFIFPDQGCPFISKQNYAVDIQDHYKSGGELENMRSAIVDCLKLILEQSYFDHLGNPFDVNQEIDMTLGTPWYYSGGTRTDRPLRFLSFVGVDASDGTREQAIWQAVSWFHRQNPEHFGRVIPRYGEMASTRLMQFYDLREGEWQRGRRYEKSDKGTGDWILNPLKHGRAMLNIMAATVPNCLLIDPNTYKTQRNDAWLCKAGMNGSLTLFHGTPEEHQMYSMHQCSEEYFPKTLSARSCNVWRTKKPFFADAEFLDTTTGCFALASFTGVESAAAVVKREPKQRPRMTKEQHEQRVAARQKGGR